MSLLRISCNAIESMSGKHQKATCVHIKSAFDVRIFQDSREPQSLSLEILEYRKSEERSCGIPGHSKSGWWKGQRHSNRRVYNTVPPQPHPRHRLPRKPSDI